MIEPQKWASALGSLSDTVTLPDEDLQFASFKKLFPALAQVPLSEGGVAPQRTDFNTLFKLLGDNIFYLQHGGVFSYSDTADYEKGSLVRYNDNIYLCIQDNSALNTHNPDDMNYWLRVALNNELAVITGKIEWFAFNTPPDGYLVCNGADVSRETYPDLFSAIGTTFGTGDGSTTFKLPDLRDRFIEGAGTNVLATYLEAGLPNITGDYTPSICTTSEGASERIGIYDAPTGAFSRKEVTGTTFPTNQSSGVNMLTTLTFNASYSNTIYSKSTTVQPSSLTLLPCIKY